MKARLLVAAVAGFVLAAAPPRASVTYILGADEDPGRPMYRLAARYFREDPGERTDLVVEDARSLREVLDRLRDPAASRGLPWGTINLVVHASAAGVLDLPALPGQGGATAEVLEAACVRGDLRPLPESLVDDATDIRVHGCAVGRVTGLLRALGRAFAGRDGRRPRVRAALHFTCFQDGPAVRRFLCEGWKLPLLPGEAPAPAELRRRFRRLNPDARVDLDRALAQGSASAPGGLFSYEAPVTFTWTAAYPLGGAPTGFSGPQALRDWLRRSEPFNRSLRRHGADFQCLHWVAAPVRTRVGDLDCPALRVVGSGRVIHVLRALPGSGSAAAWEDPALYASVR